ncbi:hypothetical protein FCK90_00745 [Kocuria coralli]|uniref:CobQ/CobB/MinD/ParA nucleotide binding domain-containing protein n=1 Tax=Kocuria coralli TaxID=1461025 RepID=A0A5J5L106_9MICC|nr:P-loop NTPase [Kocuria coralli]KAA9395589.1 hypothetical protein FCK90_00745 [Kocuria coralli]
MSLPLVTAGPAAALLAHEIDRLHGPVTLVRRASDLVEVLSVVRSGLARAVLVAECAPEFAGEAVDSLLAGGAVVAVVEGHDEDRLVRLGAILVPADLPAQDVAELLLEASRRAEAGLGGSQGRGPDRTEPTAQGAYPSAGHGPSDDPAEEGERYNRPDGPSLPGSPPSTGIPGSADEARSPLAAEDEESPRRPGEPGAGAEAVRESPGVVVVWGPHGSPGRSTVAVNVAAELAVLGHPVTLVDLDTWGPSVASLLGLLDESAGVALACRAADRNRLDLAALDRAAVRVDLGKTHIDVLTGLTRSERWPELRAASVRRLLQACRAAGEPHWAGDGEEGGERPAATPQPIVVVDVGFSLEEEEELSFDTEAPRRNAATITALEEADLVLAVVSADVLGMPRAAKSLPALTEYTAAPVLVVANKVRQAAAGRAPRAAIREAWDAIGAPVPISASVSFESATVDRAALDGSVLAEAAPASTVRTELRSLARQVADGLAGGELPDDDGEEVTGTSFGRRLSGWLRR